MGNGWLDVDEWIDGWRGWMGRWMNHECNKELKDEWVE